MTSNPGRAVVIDQTGHSIDKERPKWLAREIVRFLAEQPVREVVAATREDGRTTLLHFAPPEFVVSVPSSVEASEVIRRALFPGGFTPYWIRSPDGSRNRIWARRILTTAPDGTTRNNLRELPETTRGELQGWNAVLRYGPQEGFQVTHIRLRSWGPNPWQTYVSHLIDDEHGYQIPTSVAERRIMRDGARYYIRVDGEDTDLRVVEYLHTQPNETEEDNLGSLPDAP